MSRFVAALALAFAARRERRNLLWRFSRIKAGAWLVLFQVAATGGMLYNFRRSGFALPFPSALTLVFVQSAVWGFASAFTQERDRLYRSRIAELAHISPAPAYSLLVGNLLSDLPSRAWTGLIWAVLFSAGTPWTILLLWLGSVVVSTAAQIGATSLLVAFVRRWPRLLVWMWAATLAGMLLLTGLFLYALLHPELLDRVATRLAPVTSPMAALLLLLGGTRGAAAALRPERLGERYRESWLRFSEEARTAHRRRLSTWPALLGGAAGSVQAKEWLLILRNPLTWIRLGALLAILGALILLRSWLSTLPQGVRLTAAKATPYGAALFVLGEIVAASFPAEREKLTLFAAAGSPAGRLLLGKALAASPVVAITAALYPLCGRLFSLELSAAGLFWEGALSGIGMIAILLGAGALEAPRQHAGPPADEAYVQMSEQVPTGIFSQTGLLLAAGFGAARVWGPPLLEAFAWIAPLLALAAGWLRLSRFLRLGRTR